MINEIYYTQHEINNFGKGLTNRTKHIYRLRTSDQIGIIQ